MLLTRLLVLVLGLAAQTPAAEAWTNAGWHALKVDSIDEASADFGKALQADPNDPLALVGQATIAQLAVLMERGGSAPAIPADATVPPMPRLEGSFEALSPGEATAAYVTSAAARQALLDRAGPNVIYNLLTNFRSGMRFDGAFERAAMMPYREFIASWRSASRRAPSPLAR